MAEWFKGDNKLEYVGEQVTNPQYFGNGFGIAVNKDNQALLDQLNKALEAVKENDEYAAIFNKYFGN